MLAPSAGTSRIRSSRKDIYEGSKVQARVEVEITYGIPDTYLTDGEVTFGLVMEDGRWRITALTVDWEDGQ